MRHPPPTLSRHYHDLCRFVECSRQNKWPPVVALFSFLQDLQTCKRFTGRSAADASYKELVEKGWVTAEP
ncbi:MAG TPA: hypothetical protein VEU62_01910 [Bryobacterales bacterium]|nr:hypothetical protein [Bryobacterales bacterium]